MFPRRDRFAALGRVWPATLMPLAAVSVHQLRYLLAFGGNAGIQLQRQGHAYLHSVVPWFVLLVALGCGSFLWALGRSFAGHRSLPRYTSSFASLWLACAVCLVGIFVFQELLEGAFAAGHASGLHGVFGYGGWWAVPAALCVGLVLAAVFHGARWMIEEALRHGERGRPGRPDRRLRTGLSFFSLAPKLPSLAAGWSGRGPPS